MDLSGRSYFGAPPNYHVANCSKPSTFFVPHLQPAIHLRHSRPSSWMPSLDVCEDSSGFNSNVPKSVSISDTSPDNQKQMNSTIQVITPDECPNGLHLNPRSLHNCAYLPSHLQNRLVYSCVDCKWRGKLGKDLDIGLHKAVNDEASRDKSSTKKKVQSIELNLLKQVLWSMLAFLYGSRYLKTHAEASVKCIFHVLLKEYPKLLNDMLVKECRAYMQHNVTRAHKFQRIIDMQPTRALNYGVIDGIRKGVEELCKYEMGIIPS
jgi:hypothetical protein